MSLSDRERAGAFEIVFLAATPATPATPAPTATTTETTIFHHDNYR